MISIPAEYFIDHSLEIGAIYKIAAPDLINTSIPHYFIVIAIDDDENHMVLCTTQGDKKADYFDRIGSEYTCLVYIKNDSYNGLTEESWVNCNDKYSITREKLIKKCQDGVLSYTGKISYNHYDQIRTGIKESVTNDLPYDLLVHPED